LNHIIVSKTTLVFCSHHSNNGTLFILVSIIKDKDTYSV